MPIAPKNSERTRRGESRRAEKVISAEENPATLLQITRLLSRKRAEM